MKQRKLSLWLAMLLVFILALPVQAAEPNSNDHSGGVMPLGRVYEVSVADTVSGGDAGEDLSGKTVNLALVIDTTGSMYSYISGVVKNLSEFVRFIESTGVNFRLSLIDYRDITYDEETVVHTFDHSVWSQSTEQIVAEMQALFVDGGGDGPETLIDALGFLVDESVMTFNSDAAKFAIVLTDATYKVDNTHGIESMDDMIVALQEKGIRVSVMTESYCFSDYEDLTASTGGILSSVNDFAETLREYALSIIRATADSEVDDSIRPVTGIAAEGPSSVRPDYVYTYNVNFSPADATDKGVYWYVEDGNVAQVMTASGTTCDVRGVAEGSTRLVAVSRDGGYTSAMDITVSESAPISDRIVTNNYDAIKEALGEDVVKIYEYYVADSAMVAGEQQQEIFTGIEGKEKSFTFVFADGDSSEMYKWSFPGTKISNPNQTLDMGVVPGAGNETVLGAVKEDVDKMDIHFNHNGSLPGEATVTVSVKDVFTVDSLYLYYYNAATGTLELAAEGVSVADGYATFPLSHCSDYILTAEMLRSLVPSAKPDSNKEENVDNTEVVTEDVPEPVLEPVTVKSPKTQDNGITTVFILAFISMTGTFFFCRKLLSMREGKK